MARPRYLLITVLLLLPASAFSQTARRGGGWVDVNIGVASSGAGETVFTYETTLYQEKLGLAAAYPKPSRGADFDFGGGYMFTPLIGLGVTFSGTAHQDIAGLGISVPHPFFFNASAAASGHTADELMRTEGAANIQLMVVAFKNRRTVLRVFAGPSHFNYKADMVQDISYSQTAPSFSRLNLVDITSYDAVEATGSGWGFHAGADVGVFFSRVVGVGGFIRVSRGTATVAEPMSERNQSITVGGIQSGGGLRLRF